MGNCGLLNAFLQRVVIGRNVHRLRSGVVRRGKCERDGACRSCRRGRCKSEVVIHPRNRARGIRGQPGSNRYRNTSSWRSLQVNRIGVGYAAALSHGRARPRLGNPDIAVVVVEMSPEPNGCRRFALGIAVAGYGVGD